MPKTRLPIRGMHCASCAATIEGEVGQVDGVEQVNVNYATDTATITHDAGVGRKALVDAVHRAGYAVAEEQVEAHGHEHHDGEHGGHEHAAVESDYTKKRMLGAWALTVPAAMVMFSGYLGFYAFTPVQMDLLLVLLAVPVVYWLGRPVHSATVRAARHGNVNMDTLITMGSSVAFLTGVLVFFAPLQNYAGIATMIMAFHLTGKWLENRAKGRASEAIQKLLSLQAETARVVRDGNEVEVPVEEVGVGDVFVVKPGETIPTDGTILDGTAAVDESMVTGESMPVEKTPGEEVIGSTINTNGRIRVEATKVGEDTFLANVVELVQEAQGSTVPIQAFADRVTAYFVPAVIGLATLAFLLWYAFPTTFSTLAGSVGGWLPWVAPAPDPLTQAVFVAVAVLVIACPCALGLATPAALMVGTGKAAENGVIFRNGEAIQTMRKLDTVVLDKTGTITKGEPAVTDVVAEDEDELVRVAAAVENASEHPLAEAVVRYAEAEGIAIGDVTGFESVTGEGVIGEVGGEARGSAGASESTDPGEVRRTRYGVGKPDLLGDVDNQYEAEAERLEADGKTVVYVSTEEGVLGLIAIADTVKEDAEAAIAELHEFGLDIWMVTGDNARTAEAIAAQVGIDDILAGVLPEEKIDKVKALQGEGRMVGMVGDGINDAPALKQANVGIAIGTGTDIAIESADVTLVQGDLLAVVKAFDLSKAIFRKIRQNLFWAFGYNVLAIPIAFLGLLHPVIAEMAMASSSVSVVTNANLLKRWRFERSP